MTGKRIDPFDHYRQLAALRIEQAGFSSNQFAFERLGNDDLAALSIEYLPTKARRIYALNTKIPGLQDAWVHHFVSEVENGLFHDPAGAAQQFQITQAELVRSNGEFSLTQWKTNNDNILHKWSDRRESRLRTFFSLVDEGRAFSKGYLKAITILNAGAIVALLTFSHSVFANGNQCPQVASMLKDSCPFIFGLFFALLAMGIGYWSQNYYARMMFQKTRKKWVIYSFWVGGDLSGVLAAVFFFIGAYWARENIPLLVNCFPTSPQ